MKKCKADMNFVEDKEGIRWKQKEKWKYYDEVEDVTKTFSEEQRYYKGMYLEICEVYDDTLEVSFFLSLDDRCEIYVSYGRMYGIVYANNEYGHIVREEIKEELEKEYKINKEPTSKFINEFVEKYGMELPSDIFFDDVALMDMLF